MAKKKSRAKKRGRKPKRNGVPAPPDAVPCRSRYQVDGDGMVSFRVRPDANLDLSLNIVDPNMLAPAKPCSVWRAAASLPGWIQAQDNGYWLPIDRLEVVDEGTASEGTGTMGGDSLAGAVDTKMSNMEPAPEAQIEPEVAEEAKSSALVDKPDEQQEVPAEESQPKPKSKPRRTAEEKAIIRARVAADKDAIRSRIAAQIAAAERAAALENASISKPAIKTNSSKIPDSSANKDIKAANKILPSPAKSEITWVPTTPPNTSESDFPTGGRTSTDELGQPLVTHLPRRRPQKRSTTKSRPHRTDAATSSSPENKVVALEDKSADYRQLAEMMDSLDLGKYTSVLARAGVTVSELESLEARGRAGGRLQGLGIFKGPRDKIRAEVRQRGNLEELAAPQPVGKQVMSTDTSHKSLAATIDSPAALRRERRASGLRTNLGRQQQPYKSSRNINDPFGGPQPTQTANRSNDSVLGKFAADVADFFGISTQTGPSKNTATFVDDSPLWQKPAAREKDLLDTFFSDDSLGDKIMADTLHEEKLLEAHCGQASSGPGGSIIDADDTNIVTIGRFAPFSTRGKAITVPPDDPQSAAAKVSLAMHTRSKVLAFDWAASRICIRFTGTSCKLRLNGGGAFFTGLLRTMQNDDDECR